jgi:hypothetical protein
MPTWLDLLASAGLCMVLLDWLRQRHEEAQDDGLCLPPADAVVGLQAQPFLPLPPSRSVQSFSELIMLPTPPASSSGPPLHLARHHSLPPHLPATAAARRSRQQPKDRARSQQGASRAEQRVAELGPGLVPDERCGTASRVASRVDDHG